MAPGTSPVCRVCTSKHGVYRCPRCNAPYCSATCYKQHGENCTESFYRESATQQLRATRATPADKQLMMEILQRLHLQEQQQQQQPLGGDPLGLGLPPDHPYTTASGSGSRGFGHPAAAGGAEWEEGDEEEEEEEGGDEQEDEEKMAWLAAEAAKLGISAGMLAQIMDQAEQEGEYWEPPEDLLPPEARDALLSAAGQAPEAPPAATQQQPPQQQQQPQASSSQATGKQPAAGKPPAPGVDTSTSTGNSGSSGGSSSNHLSSSSSSASRTELASSSSRRKKPGSSSSGDREAWQPWWTTAAAAELQLAPSGLPLVQEVQSSSTASDTVNGLTPASGTSTGSSSGGGQGGTEAGREPPLPPAPTAPIPSLSALTKVPPSPLIAWQLLQLLFSYCLLYCQVQGQLLVGDWSNLQRLLVLAPHLLPPGGTTSTTNSSSSSSSKQGSSSKQSSSSGGASSSSSKRQPSPPAAPSAGAAAPAAGAAGGEVVEDSQESLPVPESAAMALAQVLTCCHSPVANLPGTISQRQQTALAAVADAGVVLQLGRSCVLLALHQLLTWVDRSREAVKALQQQQKRPATAAAPEGADSGTPPPAATAQRTAQATMSASMAAAQLSPSAVKIMSSQLKAAGQKLRYLLAWANEVPEQLYQQLAVAAATEHQQLQGSNQPVVTGVVLPGASSGGTGVPGVSSVPSSSAGKAGSPPPAAAAQAINKPLVVPLESNHGVGHQEGANDVVVAAAAAAAGPGASAAAAVGGVPSAEEEATLQAAAPPGLQYAEYVEDMDALD